MFDGSDSKQPSLSRPKSLSWWCFILRNLSTCLGLGSYQVSGNHYHPSTTTLPRSAKQPKSTMRTTVAPSGLLVHMKLSACRRAVAGNGSTEANITILRKLPLWSKGTDQFGMRLKSLFIHKHFFCNQMFIVSSNQIYRPIEQVSINDATCSWGGNTTHLGIILILKM